MKISTKGRYALRLMVDLARHDGPDFISLKDVSSRQSISIKYLEQIVTPLCHAGLLKSSRGAQGGYRLSRPPEDYTAGEILRATEGNLAPIACLEDEVNECPRYSRCDTICFWEGLARTVNSYVDSITLKDLLKRS